MPELVVMFGVQDFRVQGRGGIDSTCGHINQKHADFEPRDPLTKRLPAHSPRHIFHADRVLDAGKPIRLPIMATAVNPNIEFIEDPMIALNPDQL